MSDYTPTTEEVREMFASFGRAMDSLIYATQPDPNSRTYGFTMELYLDRWLAEVKARAWEEGALWHRANAVFDDRRMKVRFLRDLEVSNPYRQGEN